MGNQKFITRVKNGWQVRIKNPEGNQDSQWFADSAYGGKDKALKRAVRYRDKLLKQYKISLEHGRPVPRQTSNKTKTGIIGVTCFDGIWKAHYFNKVAKKQENKQFSISKHGECEAFQLACKYRFDKCGKLRVYKSNNFPCEIPVDYELIGEGEK